MVHEVIKVDELSFKEEVSLTIILLSLVFRFDNIRGCNLFNSKLQRNLVWDDEGGAMYYKLPEEKGPELDLEAKTNLERHINLRNVEPNLYQGFKGRVRGVMDSDRLASNYCSTENSLSLNFDVPGEMINQPIFIVKFSVVDNYIKDLLSFNWVKAEKVMKTCPANTKYKINGQSINFYRFLRLYLYKQVFVVLQLFPACKKFKLVVTEMYARIIVDQILEVNTPTSELMIIWHAKLFYLGNIMKDNADKKRRDDAFQVGICVHVTFQLYRHNLLARRPIEKLAARFYCQFTILQRIGKVAYQLQLPSYIRIHPVFHVSELKRATGTTHVSLVSLSLPVDFAPDLELVVVPEPLLNVTSKVKGFSGAPKVLVKWQEARQ